MMMLLLLMLMMMMAKHLLRSCSWRPFDEATLQHGPSTIHYLYVLIMMMMMMMIGDDDDDEGHYDDDDIGCDDGVASRAEVKISWYHDHGNASTC